VTNVEQLLPVDSAWNYYPEREEGTLLSVV